MNGIDKLADVLVNSIKKPDNKPKPKPYDTPAEVRRVEGDTAFVHIPGGVDETPVKLTINAKAGDSVQVRVSGGRAFLVGNASSPPTDDSRAIYVQKQVLELNNSFIENSNIVNAEIVNLKARDSELDQAIVIQSNIVKSEIYNSQIEDFTVINGVVQGLKATDAEISGKITAAEADIGNLKANKADISELEANYAHVTNGVIDNAKIGYADVNDLNAHYANIDLANVNNAWIQNGVIKDAAITDAQIIGVGANKITAGVIDASKITVTNLNADNITAGTINGQRIGTGSLSLDKLAEEVPTKEYLDDLADNLQGQIDGQIETWTGTTVPTLNNAPAVDWKEDAKKLKAHVGDIYYVVNAANDADGYTYRFTESGSGSSATYSWTLIKDNQITKALQEIQEAKGDISGIKQFDSEISSWKADTDEELSSLKGRTTTLETDMGTKVSTQTFNELSQTVDENTASITSLSDVVDAKADGSTVQTLSNTVNTVKQTANSNSSKISSLTTTLGTNADGTTKDGDIVHRTSAVEQDLSGFKTTVGSTYHKISDFNTYKTANDAAVAAAKKAGDDAQDDLDDYKGTVEETYATKSALTQTENSIKSEVSSTYATKASVPTKVSQLTNDKSYATTGQVDTAKSEATAAAISDTDNKLESYSTTTQMNSAIDQKANAITASVAETYSTKSDTDTKISEAKAEIKVTTDGISTEVAKKTDKDTIISTIRQSAESVKIKASQVEIDGTATFNAIKSSADAAYDAKGAASDAVGDLVDDLESASGTTVINGGHITTNSIGANKIKVNELTIGQSQVDGLSTALDGKQPTGDYATKSQAQGYASTAETNSKSYADTKKTEAVNAAATDATTKANNAKDSAISTAATDATTKANNAKDAAISTAATDATNKANAAEANAKKVATNYIYAGSDGIKIANTDPEHADTYQKQTADSTEFYVDGVKRSDISGNGMRVYDNDGVESASFGSIARIGGNSKYSAVIEAGRFGIESGDDVSLFNISPSGNPTSDIYTVSKDIPPNTKTYTLEHTPINGTSIKCGYVYDAKSGSGVLPMGAIIFTAGSFGTKSKTERGTTVTITYSSPQTFTMSVSYSLGNEGLRFFSYKILGESVDLGILTFGTRRDGSTFGNNSATLGNDLLASRNYQTVVGKSNKDYDGPFVVGNGDAGLYSNALAVGWNGDLKLKGDVYINCNSDSSGGKKISEDIGVNKILLSTASYMNGNQDLTFSEPVSEQLTGIVLVWSFWTTKAEDYGWRTFFVPKAMVQLHNGVGYDCPLSRPKSSYFGHKYVYIYDTHIKGHADNTATGTANNVPYQNNKWVLRYVFGC